ncbi:RhoGAP domain-containing protein [Tieghemostelium lacteum]|uniref:RhoGAP domain-containing protein n=1 Tax=Tieghemostelium lacteum TaxID=361077 RepID=A0A151ZFL3_TIELA|nr:RhoGAP domain-containing protein [Tieghemostelium lacteum]|eukprot:KYQ92654.1 RhoGAP domain-containing protein [Tieghemostelium lacteum]
MSNNNNILEESDDDIFSSPDNNLKTSRDLMMNDISLQSPIHDNHIPTTQVEIIKPQPTAIVSSNNNNNLGTSTSGQSTSPFKKTLTFTNDMFDGFDVLCKRTEQGIDQCKELLDYFKKRASIEEKYSKTVTDYFSKFKLKDENDTFQRGINIITKINEAESVIHKTFSQNLLNNIVFPFQALVKEMENRRKTLVTEGQKLRNELRDTIDDLKKAQQKYEKHCKETEATKIELISFNETDPNSSKMNQIEKKIAKCEGNAILAEEEYKQQLKLTNDFLTNQYHIRMVENLNEFEQFEAMRLQFMKSNIKNYIGVLMECPSSMESEINGHLGGISQIEVVDPENDLQHFIRQNASTKKLLSPFQFEPYMDSKLISLNQEMYNNQNLANADNSQQQSATNNNSNSNTNSGQVSPNVDENTTPSSPTLTTKTLKENIFGFFNNAKNNLKSSTTNAFSLVGSNLASSSSNIIGGIHQPTTTSSSSSQPSQPQQSQELSHSSNKIAMVTPSNVNQIFGVELEELMDQQKRDYPNIEVPLILMGFVQCLLKLNALETERLFNSTPPYSLIQKEKSKIDKCGTLDHLSEPSLVASLFKHWLKDLPNPLISFGIYDEILESPEQAWKIIESNSPILHCKVLHYTIDFLAEFLEPDFVATSKADIHQIASALSPVLIRSPTTNNSVTIANDSEISQKETRVIECLIAESLNKKVGRKTSSIENSPVSEPLTSFSPSTFNGDNNNTPSSLNSFNSGTINNQVGSSENVKRNFSSISFESSNGTDDELTKEFVEC